jgi:hypothetical protein
MNKDVRSQLFHSMAGLSKEFFEHLHILWGLPKNQSNVLIKNMPEIIRAKTERELRLARQKAIEEIGGSEDDILKVINVLHFIASNWDPIRDQPDSLVQDFDDLHLLPTDADVRENAVSFLHDYFKFLESDNARKLDLVHKNLLLPSLVRVDTVVDCRAIVESDFDWAYDDPKEYQPKINRTIPVALLKIALDQGDPVIFQCDKNDLDMIVRKLEALKKEIDAVRLITK